MSLKDKNILHLKKFSDVLIKNGGRKIVYILPQNKMAAHPSFGFRYSLLGVRSLMAQKNEQTALGYFLIQLYKIMI